MITTPKSPIPYTLDDIWQKIHAISPVSYAQNRNYKDGDVSHLSPYISRGVISTKQVFDFLSQRYELHEIEKFVQELAWRDYFQQVWKHKGDNIYQDLKQPQAEVKHHHISQSIVEARTGIEAVDNAIIEFYETGYIHNHMRMYIASLACNLGGAHWKTPADWMYYHLIDGDWASNALSWQWVAGSFSNKKYFANQENINRFFYTQQNNTFLDVDYSEFPLSSIPHSLQQLEKPILKTPLPNTQKPSLDLTLPTLLYNYYNLDPHWREDMEANRILLLEPSVFKKHPISTKSLEFMLHLAKNIKGIQIYVGEFADLKALTLLTPIYFKEHPLNRYHGIEDQRDWLSSVEGYYPSFFAFWKRCKKELGIK